MSHEKFLFCSKICNILVGAQSGTVLHPKFSSWSKTELWQVVDVEPMPVFGKFYNG